MTVIGTWNLENLFRFGERFGPKTKPEYEAKIKGLAKTINRLSPDLLGIQEIGNLEALADLVGLLDGDWHTAHSEHADPRGIFVGFLSRLPLTVVKDTEVLPPPLSSVQTEDNGSLSDSTGRGLLAVKVKPAAGHTLHLAVCHLKSKLLTFPAPPPQRHTPHDEGERARYNAYALFRRGAEAVALRSLADELLQGDGKKHDVVVMGDLNDGPTAATTQILYGPPGSQIGTGGFDRPDKGDKARLWNLAPLIAKDPVSRVFEGQPELIDHILVSHGLLPRVQKVFTGALEPLPDVNEDPAERRGKPISDHAPVLAELKY
ncbi:endonuclease/exonuclease/phosphatase family protein [Streptomyces sp. AV19]|uniref:endonuclease/exonuclease/phosphatase family protein n=1 Tax=Streptomyces sp. AV19 TaxID=2793068 RepID=UPI0018FEE9A1|nr:endonuclease/exonuclease/phosphatase family protein [Streptomyces sp. AV19]MBH1938148.1 endonuclease/exonuclease/phosphatase family protein [Streptomyces sp. AV19]MDG4534787.1 endonuclease/exonuclease/phosphatase family protein [Streptomyces sp. AV19]